MNNTFGKSIIPENDQERVGALDVYEVINDLPGNFFNNLAHIVAKTFAAPIALVSLVHEEQVFYKGNKGMADFQTLDRGVSLCSLAILDNEPTVFENSLEEPCLLTNPLVAGDFGLRFYAAAPITTPDGYNIGAVCIVDKKPRTFHKEDQFLLTHFAQSAMEAIAERKRNLAPRKALVAAAGRGK